MNPVLISLLITLFVGAIGFMFYEFVLFPMKFKRLVKAEKERMQAFEDMSDEEYQEVADWIVRARTEYTKGFLGLGKKHLSDSEIVKRLKKTGFHEAVILKVLKTITQESDKFGISEKKQPFTDKQLSDWRGKKTTGQTTNVQKPTKHGEATSTRTDTTTSSEEPASNTGDSSGSFDAQRSSFQTPPASTFGRHKQKSEWDWEDIKQDR